LRFAANRADIALLGGPHRRFGRRRQRFGGLFGRGGGPLYVGKSLFKTHSRPPADVLS